MKVTTLLAAVLIVLVAPAGAAELEIELDPGATSIDFQLGATLHTVDGSAAATSGSLRLDTESGAMAGEVTVDASTAETGNSKRDRKMHSKVLRTAEHPLIVLRAHHLDGELAANTPSDVVLRGEIVILDRPHEVEIPLHVELDSGRFSARAEFEVPYVAWGLEDPSTFVLRVSKTVTVTVAAKGSIVATE